MKVKEGVLDKENIHKIPLFAFVFSTFLFSLILNPSFYFCNQTKSVAGVCCIPASLRSPLTWLLLCMLFVWFGRPAPLSPITLSSPQPWNNNHNFVMAPWHTQPPDQWGPRAWTPKITVICTFLALQQRGYSWIQELSASSWCYVQVCCVFDYAQSCLISLQNGLLVSVGYVNTWAFTYEHQCWLSKA